MKVCVVGSNSFSGASYCKYLLEQGLEVVAVSRSAEPHQALLPYSWLPDNKTRLQFHQLDLNTQLDEIDLLLDRLKITHVVNFAAQSMVAQSWIHPEHWFKTNVVSTVEFHNRLRQKDYLEKYVHISTPEVYGSCSGFVQEDHVFNPSTPYAVSRAAADMSLKTFFNVYQFPVVYTRAANVYGEGQQLYRIIPKTIAKILKQEKMPLHGGGYSERSFIHIDDVSSATFQVMNMGKAGECYHISTKQSISIRDLVQKICDKMNVSFSQVCDDVADRPGKDAAYLLDTSKIRNELGWSDEIDLDTGLDRTLNWANKWRDALMQLPVEYLHKP